MNWQETYDAFHEATRALAVALGYRDLMTRLHSERVRGLCSEIGRHCGLEEEEMEALGLSASFHDIGKIGVPDNILFKPARLEEDERKVMQRHAEIGEKIMLATELGGCELAATLIRHHHEHYDGTGYPDGLLGEAIPICSRIISIADSYDAMAVTRPYHQAKKHEEIMAVLTEETGKKHDPRLMSVFREIMGRSRYTVD